MTKKINNSKGITLIALVITIIVLLILSGVAINLTIGENGIINRASEASEQTKKVSTEEQVKLAVLSALTAGNGEMNKATLESELGKIEGKEINIDSLPATVTISGIDYIISEDGTVSEIKKVETNVGKEITGKKAILLDANKEQIVVPVGFKIKEDSPTEVKEGIVVVAPDKSEFVWVPVKDVSTMYGTNSEGKKLGKLYDITSSGYRALNWKETNGVMSWTSETSYREPDYLSDTISGDAVTGNDTRGIGLLKSIVNLSGTDEKILSTWKTQLQKEFNEMIESVKTNKGFYVGRYETSLNTTTKYAQSKSGETSATAASESANTWYGLYQKQKEYSEKNSITNNVGSSMIWGSQYDQMMIWMQGNNINVASETPIDGASKNTTRVTGSVSTDKLNNIYDLLGNSNEWTLEANVTDYRIYRGGFYYFSRSLTSRCNYLPKNIVIDTSSRLTLYVK